MIINDSPSSQKSSWESNKKTIGDHLFKQVFVSSDGPRVPSFLSDTKNILACLPVCKKSTAFRRCWSMIKWWSQALLYTTTCTDADGDVAGDEEAGAFLTLSRVTFPNHLLLLVLVHSGFYLPGLSSGWYIILWWCRIPRNRNTNEFWGILLYTADFRHFLVLWNNSWPLRTF